MFSIRSKVYSYFKKILRFISLYEFLSIKVRKLNGPVDLLKNNAAQESYEFLKSINNEIFICDSYTHIRELVFNQISEKGLICEFGVYSGRSINLFNNILKNKNDKRNIYGFDSFAGLEVNWYGFGSPKGRFDNKGKIPFKVDGNIKIIVGDIRNTLDEFLSKQKENFSFIHLDLDTYEITKFVLEKIKDRLNKNCIILFDNYYNYPNWQQGEHRALKEVINDNDYNFFAASNEYQIAIKIK